MPRLLRSSPAAAFLLLALPVLVLFLAETARAEAVAQIATVRIAGDPQPYLDLIKKSQPITKRLGLPAFQAAQATFAGDATREIYVWAEYASLEALGQAAPKLEADAEWQALLRQLETTGRELVSSVVWRDRTPSGLTPTPSQPGGVASSLAVTVAGDPQRYLDVLQKAGPLSKRLGTPTPRVWQATFAGEETRTLYVVFQFPSLKEVGDFVKKTEADAEWQAFTKEAEATGRKVVSSSLIRHRIP